MNKNFKKITAVIKRRKILTTVVVLVVLGIVFFFVKGGKAPEREYIKASRMNIEQSVGVTGRVEPAEKVDLAIQTGGKVSAVAVKVGQEVSAGDILLRVNTSDLDIQLSRQRADLAKAEIDVAKQAPKTTSSDDLTKAYGAGFNAVTNAFLDLPPTVLGIDDILHASYLSQNTLNTRYGNVAKNLRADALQKYYAAKKLESDALVAYRSTTRSSDKAQIEDLIDVTYQATRSVADAVKSLNAFVDYVDGKTDEGIDQTEIAEDQAIIDSYTTATNLHLSELLDIQDTISDAKLGVTDEEQDVTSLNFTVDQVKLDIQDTLVQISKRIIRSPISGVVTDVSAEVGETINSSEPVVSVISANQYQIKADLPEADISKVVVGRDAHITLDAYGDDEIFKAKVMLISPAEKIIDGVSTYEVTLEFIEQDPRIKSGMTADVVIVGESREQVVAIPQRAVITRGGQKFVQVLNGETVVEKPIITGLRGADGNVEVLSGLEAGDEIVISAEGK